ncbi:conserved hypothetical protein [Sporisorium reilianum SRZ2]|uniref:DASH complex subunit DAD1 n=1 Tax=Sporisorium reilianum (strain SRZ2) TaxID=999809 RepID=E6ZRN1_SPORE|nr:conserved hypothetical protein [Sporisorium reilianum SRZ2]
MMDQHPSSYDEAQHASSSSSAGGGVNGGGDAGFFERERNRLIQDISKGVESILGNANAVNRKIEESISVGKEFHPISELWSKFERIMHASGIPNLHPTPSTTTTTTTAANSTAALSTPGTGIAVGAVGAVGEDKENVAVGMATTPKRKPHDGNGAHDAEAIRFELSTNAAGALPPGVAPGGGRIYAA